MECFTAAASGPQRLKVHQLQTPICSVDHQVDLPGDQLQSGHRPRSTEGEGRACLFTPLPRMNSKGARSNNSNLSAWRTNRREKSQTAPESRRLKVYRIDAAQIQRQQQESLWVVKAFLIIRFVRILVSGEEALNEKKKQQFSSFHHARGAEMGKVEGALISWLLHGWKWRRR